MKILKTLFYIFFPLLVGTLVGIATRPYIEYNTLNKPIFSPPSIVFPIVWSILYLLIGISYYLFKRKDDDFKTTYVYYLQLFVNYLWSFIFFVFQYYFFSIIWIILLDVLVVILFILYLKKSKVSAYLIIPYMIWLLIATYLTIGIYILN